VKLIVAEFCVAACKGGVAMPIPDMLKWFLIDLTFQRGVTSAARHSENITCRGMTSTARHAARSHSFDNISTT